MSHVLVDITETLKWQDELLAKARKIMTYPAVIGTLVLSVVMFMMIFVVPDIMDAIVGLGGEIPIETRALMATSEFLAGYWYLVIAAPFVIFFTLKYFYSTSSKARFRLVETSGHWASQREDQDFAFHALLFVDVCFRHHRARRDQPEQGCAQQHGAGRRHRACVAADLGRQQY
jgi:hypothetical protein